MNCDEPDIRARLSRATSTRLKQIIGTAKLLIIDEAQRVQNIGLTLKLLVENFPNVQIIASGSSALDLANTVNEPLTGRKFEFNLHALSSAEIAASTSALEEQRLLKHRLVYGNYPEIVLNPGDEFDRLRQLTASYLYKDVFAMKDVRKPEVLEKLVQAIALQLGNQVSYNELSKLTGMDKETVVRYIGLLEKTFVIFRLPSLCRNVRTELSKSRKIYFFDNGVRNAIIANFQPLELRNDTGALWENYLIAERVKLLSQQEQPYNLFFWRTHGQQEIDLIEERKGKLHAFEFKWSMRNNARIPKTFLDAYPRSTAQIISQENYWEFITEL